MNLRCAGWVAAAILYGGCGEPELTEPVQSGAAIVRQARVSSRDGALSLNLPTDLMIHRHQRSIMATAADGSYRLYVTHRAMNGLMRLVGETKDLWLAREWDIIDEHHFESAVELVAQRGARSSIQRRTAWLIAAPALKSQAPLASDAPSAREAVVCEAFAPQAQVRRLQAELKAQCLSVDYAR